MPNTVKKTISFAIPVYRNAGALTLTYGKILKLFKDRLQRYEFEIVFVDDGSDDDSLNELLRLRTQDARVKVISFTRNFGQMAAILAGFRYATGDAIVNISADLQDPIELVEQMVHEWEQGDEVIACYRTAREDGWSRKAISKLAYGVIRMSVPSIPLGGFDYVMVERRVADAFNAVDVRNRFFQGDLLWLGYKTKFIPYVRQVRPIGKSQYTFGKRLKNFLDAVLDSSYLPIRAMSALGALTTLIGFFYGLTVVYSRLVYSTPFTGWAPIMILILSVGGVIVLMLGVIGEYVWRIYDEVRKRPHFIINQKFI